MARCPECAGKMEFVAMTKSLVCSSCGLSLKRSELDDYWRKIREQNADNSDDYQVKKSRKKEWLEWYSKSKAEKEKY
jgi:transcription initiation factor TFIIIB Brf1 subunit/transcription initiation factor TFIIB